MTTPTGSESTVVLTRLDARGLRGLLGVLRATGAVVDDCRSVPGFRGGRVAVDRSGRAWTLTVWESPAALRAFAVLHAPVAATIDEVATGSATTAYRQQGSGVPSWREAVSRVTLMGPRRPAVHRRIPAAAVEVGVAASASA